MKSTMIAVTVALLAAAPIIAMARPYTPHHTSAATAHGHHRAYHGNHRHHHGLTQHHGAGKAERMHRRENTHHFGNPNARNPSQEGYQQQLGNTTNGPRY